MPSTPTPEPALTNKQRRKLSKKEQAAYSLEMVEVRRREARSRKIRRRLGRALAITAGVAVVLAGSGLIVWNVVRAGEVGPANMLSDGMLLTGSTDQSTGKASLIPISTDALQADAKPVATNLTSYKQTANIVLYLDYASPKTIAFYKANGTAMEQYLAAGYITLEIHPVSTSTTAKNDYSKRAANALACVANSEPGNFLAVNDALLAAGSSKKETTLSTAKIQALVTKAGVTNTDVTACINGFKYANWVTAATHRATHGGLLNSSKKSLTTVPLVLVDKTPYTGKLTDPTALTKFISETYAVSQGAGNGSTASPTPTPTPTP